MKTKLIGVLILMLVSIVASAAIASAQVDPDTVKVYYDNVLLNERATNEIDDIQRGETIPLKVVFTADSSTADDEYVEIEAEIYADSHDDEIAADVDTFNVVAGRTYRRNLDLQLTKRMDPRTYTLYVTVATPTDRVVKEFALDVSVPQHLVDIDDVMLSPDGVVKAGRSLLVSVRVENNGYRTEDGVKVEVSIPELQVSAATYIDELEPEGDPDDETSSEELYLRIPECAEAGDYTVNIDVTYDDGDEVASTTRKIRVIPGDACTLTAAVPGTTPSVPLTIIKVQDVSTGQGSTVYQMTLTNNGASSKAYTINVNTGDKLDASIQPSGTVVVAPGDSESIIVFVTPKAGTAAGQYGFSVMVSAGDEVLKQIPLTASVTGAPAASSASNLKRGLEIGLIVLVVLLVILGLIIGFNKLKGEEQEDTEGTKTYY